MVGSARTGRGGRVAGLLPPGTPPTAAKPGQTRSTSLAGGRFGSDRPTVPRPHPPARGEPSGASSGSSAVSPRTDHARNLPYPGLGGGRSSTSPPAPPAAARPAP